MRHGNTGKKLGRDHAHRKALYANLAGALIEHGRIKTTVTKAKAVKPIAEQMITLGRRGDLHARRQAVAFLRSKDVVHKLFAEIGPRFADRPGGYSRIIRLGPRAGDAAEMVYLELLDEPVVPKERTPKAASVPQAVTEPEVAAEEAADEDTTDSEVEAAVEAPAEPAADAEPDAVAEDAAPIGEVPVVEAPVVEAPEAAAVAGESPVDEDAKPDPA